MGAHNNRNVQKKISVRPDLQNIKKKKCIN